MITIFISIGPGGIKTYMIVRPGFCVRNNLMVNGVPRLIRFSPITTTRETTIAKALLINGRFFVPHDPEGLAELMGGRMNFVAQLDSLFTRSSAIHDGGNGAPDLNPKGMIGQYAHANEPGHHTIYLYNNMGQPWKTQKWVSTVMQKLYNISPEGLCGNDDTGQMSAWYVFNAMGFYPVTHGQGVYYIGTPLFKTMTLKHSKGTLTIRANNVSRENIFIRSVTLNGKPYQKNWLQHRDIFNGNAELVFEMGNTPNKNWGNADELRPPSMVNEKYN